MRQYLRENTQFLFMMFLWVAIGNYLGFAIYAFLPFTVYLMKEKKMYVELLVGFFFILILSDSRQPGMAFAENIKNVYIVMLTLFFLFDSATYFPINRIYQKFIPFFLIAIACLFFSITFLTAFQKTISYFLLLLVVTNLFSKLMREEPEVLFKKLIYFVTLLLLAGFVLRVIDPIAVTLEGRYTGILGNPNGLGVFCFLFFIIFTIIDHFHPKLFSRPDRLFILFCVLVSILLCGSRSALVSIFIFLLFRYLYRMSPFFGFIIFLLILMIYQVITTNIVEIVTYFGLQEYFRIDTLQDGSGRLVAWEFAWIHIQEDMFFGRGFSYTDYLYRLNYAILSAQGHQGNAHNSFLTFWLDTGLVGLLLYVWAFITSFIQAARRSFMAIPALYAIIFSANFESWLTGSLNPLTIQVWIILTLLFNIGDTVKTDTDKIIAEPIPEPIAG